MNVGIITFHFAHNQGAVLQCYALQKALTKMGHDVKVIDYCPGYHTIRYSSAPNPFSMAILGYKKEKNRKFTSRMRHMVRKFAKGIYINTTKKYKGREQNFSRFTKEHLNLTNKYKTIKALRKNPPLLDAYVSGSDQLWNPELVNGFFDPAYFLDFGSKDIRKITYAVSLKESYTEQEKQSMKMLCENLDAICAREKNSVADELFEQNYTVCVDPTLLFDMEDYESITSKETEEEPYIFVYGFQTSETMVEAITVISKELGIRVINGSPERVMIKDATNAYDYGPDVFLSYIKNAQFVITNSFHGTAFSVIFKKKFVTVAHTTRGKRMTELLEKLELSGRIWRNAECDWRSEVDYTQADKKRNELKIQAKDYLNKNLNFKN